MIAARAYRDALNHFRRFAADRAGNVAVMLAISIIPIAAGVGFAIDYSRGVQQRTLLQSALDSAVLAGAQAEFQGASNISSVVTNYVNAAVNGRVQNTPVVAVDTSKPSSVSATATLVIPNNFMRLIGTPNSTFVVNSEASFGSGNKLEVALVLDTTYSMTGTKIAAAQTAAVSLVNTLFAIPHAATNVKIGLVPFNYYVNVGTTYAGASWLTSTSTANFTATSTGPQTTCTTPATYSTILTSQTCSYLNDGVPTSYDCSYYAQLTPASGCTTSNVTTTNTYSFSWNGCVGSRHTGTNGPDLVDTINSTNPEPALVWSNNMSNIYGYGGCPQPLQRLTNSSTSLITQINSLTASGETFIAPALLWGWRLVSPNPPFADGAAYTAAKKAIVLMTDGFNTHSPQYSNGDHEAMDVDMTGGNLSSQTDPLEANLITQQTCQAIRGAGVTIYAVAFEVTDPVIKSVLQNCATSVSYYYDATTVSALQSAFAAIGQQMTQLRLTK